jgi:succinyl-diaminopimelate desuccinylase
VRKQRPSESGSINTEINAWIEVRQAQIVALLQRLVRINTVNPPGHEDAAVSALLDYFDDSIWNLRVFEPAPHRSSLIATLETGIPGITLLCTAHLDTVDAHDPESWTFEPFSGQLVDDHVVGRGSVDHKSPVAALTFASRCLTSLELPLQGRLILVFDADEEKGGELGAKALYKNWDTEVDMVLYAAPSSWGPESQSYFGMGQDNVITGSIGAIALAVECPAEVAYLAPKPWNYPAENAVRLGSVLIGSAREGIDGAPAWLGQRPEWRITDLSINGVLEVERRVLPGESLEAAIPASIEFLETLADQLGIDARISVRDSFPGVQCPEHHVLPQTLAREAYAVTHREPHIGPLATVTGMSRICEGLKAPCAMFGYGQLEMSHATDERMATPDLLDETKVLARSLAALLA